MVWFKRIGIAVGLLALAVAAAYFALRKESTSYFVAPNNPEQLNLAAENAKCAGYYLLMYSPKKKDLPEHAEQERFYLEQAEFHVKMGFAFSPDRALFEAQIKQARSRFGNEVIAAAKEEKVADLVSKEMAECIGTQFRSSAFIQRHVKGKNR